MNKMSIDAATQLNRILSFLPEDKQKEIPTDVWKIIKDKTNHSLNTRINDINDIKQENILYDTRRYLSFIFLNYLATEEEKEDYVRIIRNNEEQYQEFLRKKYSVDNLFKKREDSEKEESYLPVEYKEKFFIRILNKIRRLIRRE